MGTCQSDNPYQNESQPQSEEEHVETEQMQYVVLASWKHDQQNGSNKPNHIVFGKQNGDYLQSHNQFQMNQGSVQHSRIAASSNQPNVPNISNITSKPFNQIEQKQRFSAFSGYSQTDRTAGLVKDQDIQRRPINIAKRNIF
ncbi:unnamed protein product (macronuclear) [Paramecium tetraurelia]|uniref:Uncharacterized protein n=1 Tax=Paramecium tetraurelia TaxID=5888 RepID=A0CR28_PARTE|nr:uncharacterized protein GSPATT00009558001 [Paramecium tetraurelia]CAK73245.1 unnamed protein product [Paramecium tetraurelia]|eukprot:XP_001440642.1 hypothetical protein (macronuclear) [Paramecium tetraurelia strain d4-2]